MILEKNANELPNNRQGRKWQFTINNPEDHGLNRDLIIAQLQTLRGDSIYYCLCKEIGENETPHFHIFLYRNGRFEFSQLKKLFPTAHIEQMYGSCKENRDYILKDGDKFNKDENGNYEYIDAKGKLHKGTNFSDTFFENIQCPEDKKSGANKSSTVVEMVQTGCDDGEIISAVPSAYKDLDKIQRLRSLYRDKEFCNVWRDLEITYIFGETGTGKTRTIMEKYGYNNVYRVTDYKHPFDGYDGEDVIVFEEFRSGIKHGDMLNYLDGYPVKLACRYFNRQACYTKVFFTTNIPPDEQYRNIDPSSQRAFFRRFTKVIEYVSADMQFEYDSINDYFHAQRYGKLP